MLVGLALDEDDLPEVERDRTVGGIDLVPAVPLADCLAQVLVGAGREAHGDQLAAGEADLDALDLCVPRHQ